MPRHCFWWEVRHVCIWTQLELFSSMQRCEQRYKVQPVSTFEKEILYKIDVT